ncbi:PhnD/SsuA/transferrin family substrate-binding protein [Ottowia oryzae]|uniref:PhnD/SsuA/transferrin family substrate-binding protein n=1 Tax=Ottowia oryzae TaxID=2109914 RepID=UPI0013DF6523|nr:PhnD/SsuA/transferrin family substrate-binding protein [Ottowia oryzae]
MKRRLFIAGSAAYGTGLSAQPSRRLRIGVTAVMLSDQTAFLTRWAAYLSDRTQTSVSFVVRDQYRAVMELMSAGQVESAWICGYPFVRYQSSLRLLAVPLYRGMPQYQAYLIRPRGTTTPQSWSDLRGKVLAYSDPLSNSGWLVAQAQMAAAGVASTDLRGQFFAYGHRNVADAVAARLADAGAIDGYIWDTMLKLGMQGALQTEVVWRSTPCGFPPFVTPSLVSPASVEPLRNALIEMSKDPTGQGLLDSLNLSGFVDGSPALYDSIRQMASQTPNSGVPS